MPKEPALDVVNGLYTVGVHGREQGQDQRPAELVLQRLAPWFDMSRKVLLLAKFQEEAADVLLQGGRAAFSKLHSRAKPGVWAWAADGVGESTVAPRLAGWLRPGGFRLPLPSRYGAAGVTRMPPRVIIMWSPLCIETIHSRNRDTPAAELVRRKALRLQGLASAAQLLRAASVPVLAISYADLLWRGKATLAHVSEFVPCLGVLDMNTTAALRWLPGNEMSAGTVAEFARAHPRDGCCREDGNPVAPDVAAALAAGDPAHRKDIAEAEAVLRSFSATGR